MFNRAVACLLIFVSFLTVFSPVAFSASVQDNDVILVTLNVCHFSTGFMSSLSEMPVIHEGPVVLPGHDVVSSFEEWIPMPYQMLVVFEYERPPKV